MLPRPPAELPDSRAALPLGRRALLILWPAFVMAGVLEALVFAVVDPGDLLCFGLEAVPGSRLAVYSVCFFVFWGVIATSAAITALLEDLAAGTSSWPR
ncbi:MAG TPA: hypothetical protein VGE47_14080 [Burkholderiaceae bacterium]